MMKKALIIFGVLFMFFLIGCTIQKDVVEPIKEIPIDTPIQLSEKEQCVQQGKLWFYGGFPEAGYSCIEKTNQIITCEQGGGQWKMFSNGCGDNCGQKPRLCTQAFQADCDCGETKCYGQEQESMVFCCGRFNEDSGQTEYFWSSDNKCGIKAGVSCIGSCPSVKDNSLCEKPFSCIDDPYEPYATPQEACEKTNGEWILGEEGGGCNFQSTGEICGGIQGLKCTEGECIYQGNTKIIPFPDAQGKCAVTLCKAPPLVCQCPEGQIFYIDGCNQPKTDLMSIISYR